MYSWVLVKVCGFMGAHAWHACETRCLSSSGALHFVYSGKVSHLIPELMLELASFFQGLFVSISRSSLHLPGIYMGSGNPNSSPLHAWEVLYQLSHLPSPLSCFLPPFSINLYCFLSSTQTPVWIKLSLFSCWFRGLRSWIRIPPRIHLNSTLYCPFLVVGRSLGTLKLHLKT